MKKVVWDYPTEILQILALYTCIKWELPGEPFFLLYSLRSRHIKAKEREAAASDVILPVLGPEAAARELAPVSLIAPNTVSLCTLSRGGEERQGKSGGILVGEKVAITQQEQWEKLRADGEIL